ncbi:10875_t:CDS:2 [Racocetra fulgida]|uniref:10875_t:CDS:1 n=1 Tax=Racocetra fulgida TaxID=60492 RepID=A0A9N8VH77_9GLOM|nr:10875_t:CDS:2 [Racocetra fulgida]
MNFKPAINQNRKNGLSTITTIVLVISAFVVGVAIYLDSAATSLKPKIVIQAIVDYYQKYSINSHSENNNPWFRQVWKTIRETRQLVAQKIVARAEEIIFVPSATYALNILSLSLRDYLTPGDKIALTLLEHGSNLYPWQATAQTKTAEIVFLPLTNDFVIDINQLSNYINQQTKIVSFFHLSNSLGTINPVAEIAQKIKKINPECLIIVDACQNNPTEKINQLDLFLPQKFEVGTLPLAQIFGLRAGLEFTNKLDYLQQIQLRNYALRQLKQIPNLIIYNQKQFSPNIITFNLTGYHAHDIADYLGKKKILLRAGDFCCPYLAKVIGTNSALRISLDIYNNQGDIDRLIDCLQEIVNNPHLLIPVYNAYLTCQLVGDNHTVPTPTGGSSEESSAMGETLTEQYYVKEEEEELDANPVLTVSIEKATTNYVPAVAVRRRWRTLSGIIGRKGCVDGLNPTEVANTGRLRGQERLTELPVER